jgi:methylase of polypeptide subunit release factors
MKEPEIKAVSLAGVRVFYRDDLDGGGMGFGQDYLRLVPRLLTRPRTVFEWCAGPGFISFSLLAHGLCDSICLADINPAAIDVCHRTVAENGLSDRVRLYHSDCLDDIPSGERWDLVVGNPPHSGTTELLPWGPTRIYMDAGWTLHERFWRRVPDFLNPHAAVLLQENSDLSRVSDFAGMIESNGLRIVHVSDVPDHPCIYYIGAVRQEEAASLRGLLNFST